MISDTLVRAFTNAGRALANGVKDTGFTSNGLRKLDFVIRGEDGGVFTAIEQNPNKLSTPAKLQREGHKIVQIRDNNKGVLLGNVDVTDNRFNSYDAIPQPVDLSDIEAALGSDVVPKGEPVPVTATRTATPAVPIDASREGWDRAVQASDQPSGRGSNVGQFENRPGRASFDSDTGKKIA